MAEISHGGLWVRWSSLNGRDRRDFGISMVLLLVAGFLAGYFAGRFDEEPLQATGGNILLALTPLLPLLAGTLLYLRFVLRQDELFRRFHVITTLWGGSAMVGLLVPMILLERVLGVPPFGPDALLLAFAAGSILGGFWATRRYF